MKKKIQSYITDGISQADRFPDSLHPDFFQIEERDTNDFLQYLLGLSKRFNFYDLNNKIEGDWEEFFLSDINIVVRIIVRHDINLYIRQYDHLKNRLGREATEAELLHDLRELFQFIYNFILLQKKLHRKFSSVPITEPGITEFNEIVKRDKTYTEELKAFNSWLVYAKEHFGKEFHINFDAKEIPYEESHQPGENEVDFFKHVETLKEKVMAGVRNYDAIFSKLRTKYYRLQEAAEVFLHKRNAVGVTYTPHMGLLVAFFDLYGLLKKDINRLNKKHLDYYYHNILGLDYKKASPDKVYLKIDISPTMEKVVIDKGEILLINKADLTENNAFAVDSDYALTKAKIKELLSIYVSKTVKLRGNEDENDTATDDIFEKQLFTAINPVNEPADFLVANPRIKSWPLLGEDQEDISKDLMTMQPSDIGFLLASPLLFAKDGKRKFDIKLVLSDTSFSALQQCASEYAAVSKGHEKGVMHSMLKDAFYLDITGTDNWLAIYKYNINCNTTDESDQSIDISFELSAADPGTSTYSPLVHGGEYDTAFPMVRLRVNNSSFYNPYSFLQGIVLERVAIRLSVTDSKQVKLRNNISEISIVNPFPLFGPRPAIGSFIEIKNTNIFNRYTKNFEVAFNWFDLPKEKGGFEKYYEAYPHHIKNESFKVSLSGLNEGRFYPDREADQQQFNLFNKKTEPGEQGFLSNKTVIGGGPNSEKIDFLKVKFDNTLCLNEEEKSEANFKEGAIKFELTSPSDAFGAKVFDSLFPEVVMHNGRRFVTKRALPNHPYIPILKGVTVSYVLEHAESLTSVQRESSADEDVFIWHSYPFGYKQVYPGKNTAEFKLIPEILHQSNLLIGMENVIPGELISFLFQFEENNFNQFNYVPEDIDWSILHHNDWYTIPKSDILLDETNNFIKTGMVILRLPDVAGNRNTIFDPALYWIKASCNKRGNIRSRTKAVFAQVISATRQLTDGDNLSENDLFLAPGSLTQFQRKMPQIMNVIQPFASGNGRTRETERQYYMRVSEQLRHKNRAITATDISQLIMENFPDILKVKCFDTEVNGQTILPGVDLLVVVIPGQKNILSDIQEYPKVDLSKLFTIKQFLAGVLSPFTVVEVANPVYEKIKVICSVVFKSDIGASAAKKLRAGESNGILLQRLNTDIKKWITPWLYNESVSINTQGKVYLSEILNFIKRCPYVSYVTGFSVLHFYQEYDVKTGTFYDRVIDSAIDKTGFLKASVPNALLVSASEHSITVLDRPRFVEHTKTGIGGMAIGNELLIADADEHFPLHEDNDKDEDDDKLYNFYFNQ